MIKITLVLLFCFGLTIYGIIGLGMISVWFIPAVFLVGGGGTGLILAKMITGSLK